MADEILILDKRTRGDRIDYRALLFYALSPPIQVGGVNVTPTPSSELPDDIPDAVFAGKPHKAALDTGLAAFEVYPFTQQAGETNNAAAQRLKDIHATRAPRAEEELRLRYESYGLWLNA